MTKYRKKEEEDDDDEEKTNFIFEYKNNNIF